MARITHVTWKVYDDPGTVAQRAAELVVEQVSHAVNSGGVARIAVSGGSTPKVMFDRLASEPLRSQMPWDKLFLYFVDERCVPPTDDESNFRMTTEHLLSKVPLAQDHIFRMEGELPPEEAASRYEATLRNSFRLEGAETPTFDLVLLGMGDDGHTASLFPHTAGIDEMTRLVMANQVPQKDTSRITLTWPVINQARKVAFLIEGAKKTDVLARVLTGPKDVYELPSQLIRPASGQLLFLLDKVAAAKLPQPEGGSMELEG